VGALETLRRRERTLAAVRWVLAVVALLQILLDRSGSPAVGAVVAAALVLQGVVVALAWSRLETPSAWRRLATVMMAADAGLVVVHSVAAVAAGSDLVWAVFALLSMEGALRYRFRGALATAVAASAAYVLIELAVGATAGADLINRITLTVLIGAFAGAIALELDVERRLFQRMAFASQDIVGKRDALGILTAFATHVADALESAHAGVYRYAFEGWTEVVRHRRASGGIVHDTTLIEADEEGTSALLHRITWRAAEGGLPARLTLPIRLPERPAEYVLVVVVPGQRPSALTEGALLALAESTAVSLGTLDVIAHQEASNRRLERLEVLRTRFVATVAHDLRSPLTTVKGVASILRDRRDSVPPERVDAMLESVERQANRLNRLADDLLDAARLDSAQLELKLDRVELADVLANVAADAADDVETEVEEGIAIVADGPRLERVVWNLVSNALKYGRPPIVVSAERDGEMSGSAQVRIRVRDHGQGLSAAQVHNLFTDFAAGDDPASVGLGLAIVWQLVAAHGGTVTYADADPGASFTVTLPVAPVAPVAPAAQGG
jgi:signal transduction histidine kinase